MARNSKPAAEQFDALGLTPKDWTPSMQMAVKQKWSNLEVDAKVDDLRQRIADVEPVPTPTPEILMASGFSADLDECTEEAKRLKRNATVNAWRTRTQLQAALDARELRFAKTRATKGANRSKVAS